MRLTPTFLLSALLLGGLLAHGCATVSSSVMVPEKVSVDRTLGGTVRIDAFGSSRQAFVGKPLIKSDALYVALRESILTAGIFDEVIERGSAIVPDRVLVVAVERLAEPELGLDMTCEVDMRWQLLTPDRERTVWEHIVRTKETITSYDELDSSQRGRLSIESAMRSNLRRGIRELSEAPKR